MFYLERLKKSEAGEVCEKDEVVNKEHQSCEDYIVFKMHLLLAVVYYS